MNSYRMPSRMHTQHAISQAIEETGYMGPLKVKQSRFDNAYIITPPMGYYMRDLSPLKAIAERANEILYQQGFDIPNTYIYAKRIPNAVEIYNAEMQAENILLQANPGSNRYNLYEGANRPNLIRNNNELTRQILKEQGYDRAF